MKQNSQWFSAALTLIAGIALLIMAGHTSLLNFVVQIIGVLIGIVGLGAFLAQSLVDGCRRSRRRHRTVADVRSRILRQFHRLSSGRRHYPVGLMAYFFTRGIQAADRRAYMAVDRSGPAYRSRRLVSCIRNQDNGVSNRAHNGDMPYFQRIQQLWRKCQQHAQQTVADIGEKRRDGRKEVARQCLAVENKSLPLSSL